MRVFSLIIIVLSGLLLQVDAICHLWSEKLAEYTEIKKTFRSVTRGVRRAQVNASKHLPHRKFSYFELVNICPSPFYEAISSNSMPEPVFLGKGAFGVVFKVNLNGSE